MICEIILDGYHDRFWACRVCNVADCTLDTVDSHVHSREHVIASFVSEASTRSIISKT